MTFDIVLRCKNLASLQFARSGLQTLPRAIVITIGCRKRTHNNGNRVSYETSSSDLFVKGVGERKAMPKHLF